jgi:putative ABC transport system ATP-binding protein
MNEDELAKTRSNTIGFIFQAFYLQSHLTAVENVMLPMMITGLREKERIKRANELLKAVGVYDRALHKPSEMSGGQRQRVCIARALANNPRLILADEPTGNLDSKTALSVVELLKSLTKNGITVLMVTHNNTHAKMADRVLRIENGIIE